MAGLMSLLGFSTTKKSSVKKLPKYPKGLKKALRKAEAKKKREAAITARKKQIDADKKKLAALRR